MTMTSHYILIDGRVNNTLASRILKEIEQIMSGDEVILIISSHGGDSKSALRIRSYLIGLIENKNVHFRIKIYNAESAAAVIAFSLETRERTMWSGAKIAFHRGEITLKASTIFRSNEIPFEAIQTLNMVNEYNISILKKFGIKEKIIELVATDWVTLTPEECLKAGMVNSIF